MKHLIFSTIFLLASCVVVMADDAADAKTAAAMEACKRHPGPTNAGMGFSRPGSQGFDPAYDAVCREVLTRFRATEESKRQQAAAAKEAAEDAALKSIQQEVGK